MLDIPAALVRKYDRPGPRYTSYPPASAWVGTVGPAHHQAALRSAGQRANEPLSLYVHLPFCRSLCLYCGCNVIVTRRADAVDRYLESLEHEIALARGLLGERRLVSQVHLGGGTPTYLDEGQLERLHRAIAANFDILADAELAIEVDPRVTTADQLSTLRALGWNRLSFGVQDTNGDVQSAIGRFQQVRQTEDLLECARALGFACVSFDLVYGLPRQTGATWEESLRTVTGLRPDRLAVYSFAHVPALRPQQRRLPMADALGGPEKLGLLRMAQDLLVAAGYVAIGMDHFARPEDDLATAAARGCLHRNFQGYTVKTAEDVVAFGISAISDLGAGGYYQNTRDLRRYHAAVAAGRMPTERGIELNEDDRRRRAVIGSLMCHHAVTLTAGDLTRFERELEELSSLESDGLVRRAGPRLEATELGRFFIRNIAMVFDAAAAGRAAPALASRTV